MVVLLHPITAEIAMVLPSAGHRYTHFLLELVPVLVKNAVLEKVVQK